MQTCLRCLKATAMKKSVINGWLNFQTALKNPRAKWPASDEVNSNRTSDKYQSTRYSQLSTFGLTFQICEMYEETECDRVGSALYVNSIVEPI